MNLLVDESFSVCCISRNTLPCLGDKDILKNAHSVIVDVAQ